MIDLDDFIYFTNGLINKQDTKNGKQYGIISCNKKNNYVYSLKSTTQKSCKVTANRWNKEFQYTIIVKVFPLKIKKFYINDKEIDVNKIKKIEVEY